VTTSIRLSAFVLGALASTACATIMHGSRQDLSIASVPSGASVTINGQDRGKRLWEELQVVVSMS
jgi:hypothetical protein